MRLITKEILGLERAPTTFRTPPDVQKDAGFLQRQAKKMIKAGDSVEKAVLKLSKTYKMSLGDLELLHLSLAGV